jgi:hypothetical protein
VTSSRLAVQHLADKLRAPRATGSFIGLLDGSHPSWPEPPAEWRPQATDLGWYWLRSNTSSAKA